MERLIVWQRCLGSAHDDEGTVAAQKRHEIAEQFHGMGGELLACLGSTVVAAFDPMETMSVLDRCVALAAGDTQLETDVALAFGVTLGEVHADPGDADNWVAFRGQPIDHAQVLANRARAGEVVLDGATQELVAEEFLFGRDVAVAGLRGATIDRTHPRRRLCRAGLAHIPHALLSPPEQEVVDKLEALHAAPGSPRVTVRGASLPVIMQLIETARARVAPPLVLHLGRVAGGLQPLGGLQLALRRRTGPEEQPVAKTFAPLKVAAGAAATLQMIADGCAVPRIDAVQSLRALVEAAERSGGRPWFVLESVHDIDAASLGVMTDAALQPGGTSMVVSTRTQEGPLPAPIASTGETHELQVPALKMADARKVAEHALSQEPGSELARRVAALGGDSSLGVTEAAKTLVAAGDLIHDGRRFVWRTTPREGTGAVSVDALLAERLSGLDPAAYRMLEVLCASISCAPRTRVTYAASFDGLEEADHVRALEVLRAEGLIDASGRLEPASALVRTTMRNHMPPARVAELHRYTIEAVRAEPVMDQERSFAHALLGFHLAEGGLEAEAATALLEAARGAYSASFPRSAVRLAAAAVQLDGSTETRLAASRIARAVDRRDPAQGAATSGERPSTPPPTEAQPDSTASNARTDSGRLIADVTRAAIAAILSGDADAIDRSTDTLLAAGCGPAAAQRLRAMAHLAKGNLGEALRTLEQAAQQRDRAQPSPRDTITTALVQLQAGQTGEAIRSALEALSGTNSHDDRKGQTAALHVLAACYRALDRPADAARLDQRATSLAV